MFVKNSLFALIVCCICSAGLVYADENSEKAHGQPDHQCDNPDHDHHYGHDHDTASGHGKSQPAHHKLDNGEVLGRLHPEFSVIGNFINESSNNKENSNRGRLRAREIEAAMQASLLDNFRINAVWAMEQEYIDNHSQWYYHLEELYGTVNELPFEMEGVIGRRLVRFGALNPVHLHERPFADTPLVLANLFGQHSWYDDGVSLSMPVGEVFGTPVHNRFSYFRGRNFGLEHTHHHGHDEHEEVHGTIEWGGNVYMNRLTSKIELDRISHAKLGYSIAFDEGGYNNLHGLDLTYRNRGIKGMKELAWQSELIYADIDTSDSEPFGMYSMLQFVLDDNWDVGGRYDWSEAPGEGSNNEWAVSPFVTYHLNESMYGRLQYRYREMIDDHEPEHTMFLQFVVELGKHSH